MTHARASGFTQGIAVVQKIKLELLIKRWKRTDESYSLLSGWVWYFVSSKVFQRLPQQTFRRQINICSPKWFFQAYGSKNPMSEAANIGTKIGQKTNKQKKRYWSETSISWNLSSYSTIFLFLRWEDCYSYSPKSNLRNLWDESSAEFVRYSGDVLINLVYQRKHSLATLWK